MTEGEAQAWCVDYVGSRSFERLCGYVDLLTVESERQNLIAPSTKASIWARHIVDSLQLIRFAPQDAQGVWVDVGSGAGLPGMVVAAATEWRVALIEPRKLRADFLMRTADVLDIADQVSVRQSNAEHVRLDPAAVVSARAVAKLDKLFADAQGFADLSTTFVLPKGASAQAELENAAETWQGSFHVEQSLTDPAAGVIVATQVRRR